MKKIKLFGHLVPESSLENFIKLRMLHKNPECFDERITGELFLKEDFISDEGQKEYSNLSQGLCPFCTGPIKDIDAIDDYFQYCPECDEDFDLEILEMLDTDINEKPCTEMDPLNDIEFPKKNQRIKALK